MPKESKAAKVPKGERTRKLILETAAVCFAEQGIDHTTTRSIAAKAGISRGLVSHYCPKMDDLLELVVDHIVNELRAEIRKNTDDLTAEEKILQQIRGNFESFEKRPHYYHCFLLSYYYSSIKKQFSALHKRINEETFNYWLVCIETICKEHKSKLTEKEIHGFVRACIHETEGSMLYYFVTPPLDKKKYIEDCVLSIYKKISTLSSRV